MSESIQAYFEGSRSKVRPNIKHMEHKKTVKAVHPKLSSDRRKTRHIVQRRIWYRAAIDWAQEWYEGQK